MQLFQLTDALQVLEGVFLEDAAGRHGVDHGQDQHHVVVAAVDDEQNRRAEGENSWQTQPGVAMGAPPPFFVIEACWMSRYGKKTKSSERWCAGAAMGGARRSA